MKTKFLLSAMLVFFIFSAWGNDNFEKEAQDFVKLIKKTFMSELKAAMSKGPYDAINACHVKVPHILEGKQSEKFNFGRTSHKLRNENNKAPKWLEAVLKEYQSSNAKMKMRSKTFVVNNKKTFVEPIYIKAQCLVCHGKPQGAVKKKLDKLYPKDKAVGFKLGDFRGLFWVQEK